jgi:outer membrane protein OmpA-like peptidoglycan-associated protein
MPVIELNSPASNEAMQSVSADGTQLIFFRNGLLYSTTKTQNGWEKPTTLPDNINIAAWQSDAMITSDGRAMLFSAQKQVENEVNTSVNIFVSVMDENGNWGEPIDLGPMINTPGLERKPFLHPDMRTMYFSSDRHGNLGDLDVFKTTRLNDNSWTEWSEPVNLSAQINSPRQEWGYKISTDGSTAYYSNGDDLYMLELPLNMRPNAVATISGTVRDETGRTVGVTIRWEDLDTHESIGQSQTDPSNGTFYLVLPLGKNYGYYIDDERYFPLSNNIDLREQKKTVNIEKNIQLTSYKQMIEQGMAVQVNNLFFPVNEYELLPQSENELVRVAEIIKSKNLRVEISGHTDSTGDTNKNMVLSRQRAESVRTFLIQQGCDASQLVAKGYGATRPIADNVTEEGKQLNRRVELQFIK